MLYCIDVTKQPIRNDQVIWGCGNQALRERIGIVDERMSLLFVTLRFVVAEPFLLSRTIKKVGCLFAKGLNTSMDRGATSQYAYDVVMTLIQRCLDVNNVVATLKRRRWEKEGQIPTCNILYNGRFLLEGNSLYRISLYGHIRAHVFYTCIFNITQNEEFLIQYLLHA